MTPEQIQRAKIKAQQTKEDAADKPIVDVILAVEEIKEFRAEKLNEAIQKLDEVVKIEENIKDGETFLAAKNFVTKQGFNVGNSIGGKIVRGLWRDFLLLPKRFWETDLFNKVFVVLLGIFQILVFLCISKCVNCGIMHDGLLEKILGWMFFSFVSAVFSAMLAALFEAIIKDLTNKYK